jgi:hypothetical protein
MDGRPTPDEVTALRPGLALLTDHAMASEWMLHATALINAGIRTHDPDQRTSAWEDPIVWEFLDQERDRLLSGAGS